MNHKVSIFLIAVLISIGFGSSSLANEPKISDQPRWNEKQGWNEKNKFRGLSYYTTQGSRLIPYDWFLALEQPDNVEQPDSEKLFKNSEHIEGMGFLMPSTEERETYKKELE